MKINQKVKDHIQGIKTALIPLAIGIVVIALFWAGLMSERIDSEKELRIQAEWQERQDERFEDEAKEAREGTRSIVQEDE
jgi:hypothetical protein